jgi:ribosomal protein S18 acetylase RimI-like enzyme
MDKYIRSATPNDSQLIANIGRIAVEESHQNSCSDADMKYFLETNYSEIAIANELNNPANIYNIIFYKGHPAGFSKIVLNAVHPNIDNGKVTKLDRIYLLGSFYDLKLGFHLLRHNIALSKENDQYGMWLFTWIKNERAVNFYKKIGFSIIGDHRFKVSDTHYNVHHQMFLKY